jgi:peptidoglycan LD-endopeptidase CwlK
MPAANFARLDLDLIYPMFLERVLNVIAACEARGARYVATHGFRTYGEQMALWSKGRTVKGKIVTNAKGGESAHNFGLAIDFVRDLDMKTKAVEPGWDAGHYDILAEEAEKAGLHSGRGYKDYPHISWPGYITATDLAPLKTRWELKETQGKYLMVDRLKEVWKAVVIPN